jgi:hypothetical protein
MTNAFQIGKTYATSSTCDSECIFSFVIRGRTAKSVLIDDPDTSDKRLVRRRIHIYEGNEQFKPFGTYSMCTIIGADDLIAS